MLFCFPEKETSQMTVFVETNQFTQMISYNPYASTKQEKKEVKYNLLDQIKAGIGDKWNRLKDGTRQAFDMICFFSAELGFFYASDEYLAERHDISDRTVRNRLRELEELGQVVKVYRRAKRCNGRGKPVYLFVNHPYFQYWVNLLNLNVDFLSDFQTESEKIACESKAEGGKNIATYSLPTFKQESNNKASKQLLEKYAKIKINDILKKGVTVKYISSYITKLFNSLENQSLYDANEVNKARRKKQQEQAHKWFNELNGTNEEPVPFYNWLESR
jgi:predicted ArsR family transcriptional regulator